MKVFLSTPISKYQSSNGLMEEKMVKKIQFVLKSLQPCEVFNAAKIEEWGKSEINDYDCAIRDFAAMKECDVVVALICERSSEGVLIELGWASALHIPIIAIIEIGARISKLLRGLPYISQMILCSLDINEENAFGFITKGDIKECCLIYKFVSLWREKLIYNMQELCSDNVILRHPYFKQDVIGNEEVIKCLSLVNADFNGNSEIKQIDCVEDGKGYIVKISEYSEISDLDLYQYIVLKFVLIEMKISCIEFLGMEIHDNQSQEKELTNLLQKKFESDEEAVFELAKCWEENKTEEFISLFEENAVINHPVYINPLSPRVFVKLMNATVAVKVLVRNVDKICIIDMSKVYRVTLYEKVNDKKISKIELRIEYNSHHKITELRVIEYLGEDSYEEKYER